MNHSDAQIQNKFIDPFDGTEKFLYQNITRTYYCISDINLEFTPHGILDLTHLDPSILVKSRDLRGAMDRGAIRRITPETYQKEMEIKYKKERNELEREQYQAKMRKIKKGNELEFDAEVLDMNSAKKKHAPLNFEGTASDSISYVKAYEIAFNLAQRRGEDFSATQFGDLVNKDPSLVPRLLSMTENTVAAQTEARKVHIAKVSDNGNVYPATTDFTNSSGLDAFLNSTPSFLEDVPEYTGYENDNQFHSEDTYDPNDPLFEEDDFAEVIVVEDDGSDDGSDNNEG